MSLTYWPNADYAPTKNSIKRLTTSTPFPTFEAALSKMNSWERDVKVLWAWIDVKEGRKKIEKVQLVKNNEGLWSGEPTVSPVSDADTSPEVKTAATATPATPGEVVTAAATATPATPGEVVTAAAAATAAPATPGEVVAAAAAATVAPIEVTVEMLETEKKSRHYSTATKLAMVERLKTEGIGQVSRETGITTVSLRAWKRQAEAGKLLPTTPSKDATVEAPLDAPEQVAAAHAPAEATVDAPSEATQVPAVEQTVVDTMEDFNGVAVQLSLMGDEPVSISTSTRKKYSFETKLSALTRAREIGVAAAAREMGIRESILYRWRKEATLSTGPMDDGHQEDQAEPDKNGHYSFEVKLSILDRVKEQGTSYVSRQTGIPMKTLRRWIKEAGPGFFDDGNTSLPSTTTSSTSEIDAGFNTSEPDSGVNADHVAEDKAVHSTSSGGDTPTSSGGDEGVPITAREEKPEEKRSYTDEEKLAILDLVATDGFVEVSRELGIPKATLRSWKRRAKRGLITAAASPASSTSDDKHDAAPEVGASEEAAPEDKETVLALVSEHGVETVAQEMGIPEDVIRAWQASTLPTAEEDQSESPVTVGGADLLASLTKENEELKIQVALLEAKLERYKRAIEALMG